MDKEGVDGQSEDVLLRARILVDVVGLRLALTADYRSSGDAKVVAILKPLAVEVAHLSKWPLLQGVRRRPNVARLERLAALLGLTVDVRSTFPAFVPSVQDAVEGLRGSFGFGLRGPVDIVVDTADLVKIFTARFLSRKTRNGYGHW